MTNTIIINRLVINSSGDKVYYIVANTSLIGQYNNHHTYYALWPLHYQKVSHSQIKE